VIYRAEKELDALIVASQMESNFDIDKILNDKAKKRKFTKTNVKNLIKVLCISMYSYKIYLIYIWGCAENQILVGLQCVFYSWIDNSYSKYLLVFLFPECYYKC